MTDDITELRIGQERISGRITALEQLTASNHKENRDSIHTDREKMQSIIDTQSTLALAFSESTKSLAAIENRVKGIDGNGTGRSGVLQSLDIKVDKLAIETNSKIAEVSDDVKTLLSKAEQTKGALKLRQQLTNVFFIVFTAVMGVLAVWSGEWLKHKMGW